MLHIFYGRAGSGKTRAIINKIGQAMHSGRQCILIVPDQSTFAAEQQLCAQLHILGFINIEVLSFNRLASRICAHSGSSSKTFLDDRGKAMLLRAVVEQCREQLTVYAAAAKRAGFCERLGRMLALLQSCNITPDMLTERTETLSDGLLRAKLTDTTLLYRHFTALMQESFTDSADMLRTATALTPQCELLNNTEIFIDGFDMLTAKLFDFIQALMGKAEKLTLSICHSLNQKDKEHYALQENIFTKVQKLAEEMQLPVTLEKVIRPPLLKSPEIEHIENQLFAAPYKQYHAPCENLHIFMAATREAEVRFAGQTILKTIQEKGMRYRDFCVLCNDMEGYGSLVFRVFEDLGLPVFTDVKRPVLSHPFVLFLLSALRCCVYDFKPAEVSDYIASGFTCLSKEDADWLLGFIRQYGVQGWELERGLKEGRAEQEHLIKFESLRAALIKPLSLFQKKLNAAKNIAEQVYICFDFLQKQSLEEKLKAYIERLEELHLPDAADHSAQIWNITVALFQQMELLLASVKLPLPEFVNILAEGFATAPAAVIPSVLDCVLFGDIGRSKSQDVQVTFVLGLNDGVLPAYGNSEAILSIKETDQLNEQGFGLTPDHTMLDLQHRFDIYAAFTRCTHMLYLTHAQSDSTGTSYKPSVLINRLHKLFPQLHEGGSLAETYDINSLLTPRYAMLPLAAQINTVAQLDSPLQGLYAYMSNHEEYKDYLQLLKNVQQPLPESSISQHLAAALFSSGNAISVTRLEGYATCPYKHFVEYGLRPMQEQKYEPNAIDTGNLFHNVIENFSRLARTRGWENIDRDSCYQMADALFEEQLPSVHFGAMLSTARQRQVNRQLKNIVRLSAWTVTEQVNRSKFKPLGEEITFGYGANPPIEVQTPYGKLYLKGKIDRADILQLQDAVYVRIVDYKSSGHDYKKEKMEAGIELQLLTYMGAMLKALGEKSRPAGAFYYAMQEHEVKSKPQLCGIRLDEPWVDEALDNAQTDPLIKKSRNPAERQYSSDAFLDAIQGTQKKTEELSTLMLKGNISAAPLQEEVRKMPCDYCEGSRICRFDKQLYKNQIRYLKDAVASEDEEEDETND